jgi:hypothetical protein
MAGVTAQGATFTFTPGGAAQLSAIVTGISVETPVAEVTDMTSATAAAGTMTIVPTGEWSGGSVSVDYIHAGSTQVDPQTIVRKRGSLSFASAGYGVTRNVILESATTEATVGDIVRGTLRFRITDYYGS